MDKVDELLQSITYLHYQEKTVLDKLAAYNKDIYKYQSIPDEVVEHKECIAVFALERLLDCQKGRLNDFENTLATFKSSA